MIKNFQNQIWSFTSDPEFPFQIWKFYIWSRISYSYPELPFQTPKFQLVSLECPPFEVWKWDACGLEWSKRIPLFQKLWTHISSRKIGTSIQEVPNFSHLKSLIERLWTVIYRNLNVYVPLLHYVRFHENYFTLLFYCKSLESCYLIVENNVTKSSYNSDDLASNYLTY